MTDLEKQLAASLSATRQNRDLVIRAQVRLLDAIAGLTSAVGEIGVALGTARPSYEITSATLHSARRAAALLDLDLARMPKEKP